MDDSVARRYVDAWNSLDPDTVAGVYAEDCVQEDLAMGKVCRGHDALKAFVREVKGVSSDTRMVITSEQVSGDHYAVEWLTTGTNTGYLAGGPATNKAYRFQGVSVGRVNAEGKITENRDYYNPNDLMRQLGLMGERRGE